MTNGTILARGALKPRRAVNPLTRVIAESDPFHVGHSSVVSSASLRSDSSSYGTEDIPFADPSGNGRCRVARRRAVAFLTRHEQREQGKPRQNQSRAVSRMSGIGDDRAERHSECSRRKYGRQPGIARRSKRPVKLWLANPQNDQRRDGQSVKNPSGEDHISEKLLKAAQERQERSRVPWPSIFRVPHR